MVQTDRFDFSPVVTDAIFRDSIPGQVSVNVPLVLVRHVAELPSVAAAVEMAAGLRQRVEALRRERRASFAWAPAVHSGSSFTCPGTVELFFREETMQVWAKAALDTKAPLARALILDPNGALLLQGTLNLFVACLNPLADSAGGQVGALRLNRDMGDIVEWAQEGLAGGATHLDLFGVPLSDRYGRETVLRAAWDVGPAHASWQWEFDGRPQAAYFTPEQAAWVSGFITLVRLAYPDEWVWQPLGDSPGKSRGGTKGG
ncbi:MAG: hypothetical protein JXD18_13235 [Anaerolineae bacterium]|nr:hypothetical protein [Anaerolineae bacterium]